MPNTFTGYHMTKAEAKEVFASALANAKARDAAAVEAYRSGAITYAEHLALIAKTAEQYAYVLDNVVYA